MYESFYGLQKRPFSSTPDPDCFYAPEGLQAILDEAVVRVQAGQGLTLITGPAGTGKTLFCRRLIQELGADFTPIYLAHTGFVTRRAFFQAVNFELDRRFSGMEEQELRLELVSALRGMLGAGKPGLLIVDEAHQLTDRLLEEIRMLATLAERDAPLLRAVLVGQPLLEEKLLAPGLEAFNQRVVCHRLLEPLSRSQSIDYLEHRLRWAGGDSLQILEPAALEFIAEASSGLPRCLNQLADHSLLLGYAQEERPVSRATAAEALEDLKQLPLQWHLRPKSESLRGDACDEVLGADEFTPGAGPASSPEPCAPVSSVCIEVGAALPAQAPGTAPEPDGNLPAPNSDFGGAPRTAAKRRAGNERRAAAEENWRPRVATEITFEEEAVDDRYAALDRQRHGSEAGTFSDLARGCAAPPAATAELMVPSAPQSAAPPEDHRVAYDAVQRLDEVVELIELSGAERAHDPLPGASEEQTALDRPPHRQVWPTARVRPDEEARCTGAYWDEPATDVRFIESFSPEREELESEVGSQALDACLELQQALSTGEQVSDEDLPLMDAGVIPENESQPAHPAERDYDVILPEPAAAARSTTDARPAQAGGEAGVAAPNYRRVFSLLRRKGLPKTAR